MVRPAPRKVSSGVSLAPWLGAVLLAAGIGLGWGGHAWLGPEPQAAEQCPEPEPAPACPVAAEDREPDSQRLPVYASELTGEGVIEFKFYGPDGTEITRKWTTRIPLSAMAEAPPSVGNDREQPTEQTSDAKPEASPAKDDPVPAGDPPAKTAPAKTGSASKTADKKSPAKPATASKSAKGKYTVQTGAYKDRESAEAQVAKLERRGYDARIEKAVITGKGTWYRVRVGSQLSQSEASTLAGKIRKSTGLDASAVVQ